MSLLLFVNGIECTTAAALNVAAAVINALLPVFLLIIKYRLSKLIKIRSVIGNGSTFTQGIKHTSIALLALQHLF